MQTPKRGIVWEIGEHRAAFALAFVAFFVVSYAFLAAVGATPDPAGVGSGSAAPAQDSSYNVPTAASAPENPLRVVAASIKLDVSVSNPSSTDVDVLDQALLSGAVRYPTSALVGVDGTVLLFGHSSYLPIVHNQAYKTFDGIQNLKEGDVVSVYSSDLEYQYRVVGVRVANADADVVDLPQTGRHLVLVTCDSFASKSHRFVVTADFVGSFAVGN